MYKINNIPSFWGLVYNAIVSHGKVKNAQSENTDGKKKFKSFLCSWRGRQKKSSNYKNNLLLIFAYWRS